MNCLITGAVSCSEKLINYLEGLGWKTYYLEQEQDLLSIKYDDIDMVFCNGLFLYHRIEKFKKLKYIQLTSAGYDRVPMDYVKDNNISIFNARGVYSIPMAEFSVCGVLQLYKQSRYFFENQKNHDWEKHRNLYELYGKNVLIVGCGSVGTECARRFKSFGCSIYGIDIKPYKNDEYEEMYSLDMLDEKLAVSDIVVLTLPLTEQTKYLFNRERFNKMKKNSVLVNIARGAIIHQEELIFAIKTKLLGAVLDVFESEPLESTSPLWDMENVILTPHNSFVGESNKQRLYSVIIKNLENYK